MTVVGRRSVKTRERFSSNSPGFKAIKQITPRRALRCLLECSFDGVLIVDLADRICDANAAACRILGQSYHSLIGKRVRDFVGIQRRAATRRSAMEPEIADRPRILQTWERPDKSLVDVVVHTSPGVVSQTRVHILRDITADRPIAEALERKSRLLMEAQRIGRIGAWELDVKTGLLAWTPELRRIMGVSAATATMTVEESYRFYTDASRKIVREAFNATMTRGTPYDLELEVITGRGHRIWVREVCRATMHRDHLVSLIGVSQDITERRHLADILNNSSNQERVRFGADLHDGLGQELTGFALLLRSMATRAAREGPTLLADLLELSKLASKSVETVRDMVRGTLSLELRDIGFRGALQQLARSASKTLGMSITVRFRGVARHLPVGPAAENLYRIAQEAINNAVRHGHAQRVSLQVHAGQANITLTVLDNGIGIDLNRNSKGMGLQIMRYRARTLGGLIDIRRMRGRGTQVRCVVPRAPNNDPAINLREDGSRNRGRTAPQ